MSKENSNIGISANEWENLNRDAFEFQIALNVRLQTPYAGSEPKNREIIDKSFFSAFMRLIAVNGLYQQKGPDYSNAIALKQTHTIMQNDLLARGVKRENLDRLLTLTPENYSSNKGVFDAILNESVEGVVSAIAEDKDLVSSWNSYSRVNRVAGFMSPDRLKELAEDDEDLFEEENEIVNEDELDETEKEQEKILKQEEEYYNSEKYHSAEYLAVLSAEEGPLAHININGLTGARSSRSFDDLPNFSRDFYSGSGLDNKKVESVDYSISTYKKGIISMLKYEDCSTEVVATDVLVDPGTAEKAGDLIAGTKYKSLHYSYLQRHISFMTRDQAIEHYRNIEARALGNVLNQGHANGANYAFLNKQDLKRGTLNFDMDKIEAARHILTDDELFAIYAEKVPSTEFNTISRAAVSALPTIDEQGFLKNREEIDEKSDNYAIVCGRTLAQIHNTRSFWWKLRHPILNARENNAVSKIEEGLIAQGLSKEIVGKLIHAKEGPELDAAKEVLHAHLKALNTKTKEGREALEANQEKAKAFEKESAAAEMEAVKQFATEKREALNKLCDVKVLEDGEGYQKSARGIANTVRNLANYYQNNLTTAINLEKDLASPDYPEARKASDTALLSELKTLNLETIQKISEMTRPDFAEQLVDKDGAPAKVDTKQFIREANRIIYKLKEGNEAITDNWTNGNRSIQNEKFLADPNEWEVVEYDQANLENQLENDVIKEDLNQSFDFDKSLEEDSFFKDQAKEEPEPESLNESFL